MILNLKVTVTPAPGREPERVADVDIVIVGTGAAVVPVRGGRYLVECKDAANATLGRAVEGGLSVKHTMRVDEEPDC